MESFFNRKGQLQVLLKDKNNVNSFIIEVGNLNYDQTNKLKKIKNSKIIESATKETVKLHEFSDKEF